MKISTLAEVALLNSEETMSGYWHGIEGGAEPGSSHTRSFRHGWRNGMVDAGHAEPDWQQLALIAEFAPRHAAMLN